MAFEMCLELEGNSPDWRACEHALVLTNAQVSTDTDGRITEGHFRGSGAVFWTSESSMPMYADPSEFLRLKPITAEGAHGCSFLRRYVLIFRLTSHHDVCAEDMRIFLTNLSELSQMQFVLSYQFEDVYAVNCKGQGFQFFWREPRGINWQPKSAGPIRSMETAHESDKYNQKEVRPLRVSERLKSFFNRR